MRCVFVGCCGLAFVCLLDGCVGWLGGRPGCFAVARLCCLYCVGVTC